MSDIDILVMEHNLDRAEESLSELAYSAYDYESWSKDWFRENSHHLNPFFSKDNWIKVEIHRDIIPPWKSIQS